MHEFVSYCISKTAWEWPFIALHHDVGFANPVRFTVQQNRPSARIGVGRAPVLRARKHSFYQQRPDDQVGRKPGQEVSNGHKPILVCDVIADGLTDPGNLRELLLAQH
jgi:hypothetical protein